MNKFEVKNNLEKVNDFINNKKGTRGRKSLEESKKRNNVISIYLNDEDFKKVKEKAEKARLPISQYITLKVFQNED